MNWELAEVERFAVFPPPGGVAWAILFLCVAVAIARRWPAALPSVWIASSLLLIVSTFLWRLVQGVIEHMGWMRAVEVVVLATVPSGLPTFVLFKLRSRSRVARLPTQVLCAVVALVVGVALGTLALIAAYRLTGPGQAG